MERTWLWIVNPFSCVEAKEGVGREASSFSQARQEERKGEGVVHTCGPQVAQFMDSQTFPLCNSRMKSSETCPSLAMLDLTVFLTSWLTSRLLKGSVSTSCVLVSDSSPAAGHGWSLTFNWQVPVRETHFREISRMTFSLFFFFISKAGQ